MADPVAEHQEQVAAALKTFHIDLPSTGLARAIDPVIEWLGKASSVIWPILVIVITANVLMRYVVGRGLVEFEEIQWHFYAIGFLLAQAWAAQGDGHVRIDVLAEHYPNRAKCWIEFIGIAVFLLPFIVVVLWYSVPFIAYSFRINEISEAPGGLPYRWAIKAFLFIGFALLAITTVARLSRVLKALFGPRGAQER
jgi:TRAP-type mannitol/chloroaromatic compound transport system permease small subunit